MMDKRKACEAMLDAQLEELSAQIGLFRPTAYKNAIDGSREGLQGGGDEAWAEWKTSFPSGASKFK